MRIGQDSLTELAVPGAIFSFFKISSQDAEVPPHFDFDLEGTEYRVVWNADAHVPANRATIRVKVEPGFFIEDLLIGVYDGDLLLLYEVSNMDEGTGFLARFGGVDLTPKWTTPIPTINLGEPAIRKGCAYVSGLGFLGKISLGEGTYLWQLAGLYRPDGTFGSFGAAQFHGDRVIFQEDSLYPRPRRSIAVNEESGAILRTKR